MKKKRIFIFSVVGSIMTDISIINQLHNSKKQSLLTTVKISLCRKVREYLQGNRKNLEY